MPLSSSELYVLLAQLTNYSSGSSRNVHNKQMAKTQRSANTLQLPMNFQLHFCHHHHTPQPFYAGLNFSRNARELSSLTVLAAGTQSSEMNGRTGTQTSQQFPQDFRSLIIIYVTYTRQNTQSNYSSFRQSKRG